MATSVQPLTNSESLPRLAADVLPQDGERSKRRIDSVDLLRGIVMVIMMLDHTRDFIHNAALQFDPVDPQSTNVALFFTRWITHYCAPTFVFLAGTGAYFQFMRGKSKSELSRFLVTRGLWLIFLEFTVVRFGAFFNFNFSSMLVMMQVIWVIGVSMIVLAALIHLPLSAVIAFGAILVLFHNLLDPFFVGRVPGGPSLGQKLWMILHQQSGFPIAGPQSPGILMLYPLIPWVGVMALGYAFGALYQMDAARRRTWLLRIGGIACALFIIVRAPNIYGDPNPWQVQSRGFVYTILSFLNTTKYPPSLLFLLMTLGPSILSLALFESTQTNNPGPVRNFFVTFGRVPLFFYLLQWPTAHLISVVLHLAFGKPTAWLFQTPFEWFTQPPQGIGFNLGVVYLSWIAGVLILYPLCRWFAGVKARRRDWWLSYL